MNLDSSDSSNRFNLEEFLRKLIAKVSGSLETFESQSLRKFNSEGS